MVDAGEMSGAEVDAVLGDLRPPQGIATKREHAFTPWDATIIADLVRKDGSGRRMMADTHIGPHALDKAAPSLAIDAAVSAFVLCSSGDVLPPELIAHLHKAAKLLATLLPHIVGRRDRDQATVNEFFLIRLELRLAGASDSHIGTLLCCMRELGEAMPIRN